jgi:hypothetical protein
MAATRGSNYGGDAAELVELAPDVVLAIGPDSVAVLLDATRTVPIVFAIVPDPVGAGFVTVLQNRGSGMLVAAQYLRSGLPRNPDYRYHSSQLREGNPR